MSDPHPTDPTGSVGRRERGFATLLIVVYGILALAATGRAGYELATKFTQAPLPYALSLLSALTYLVVTILLVRRGSRSRAALWVCGFELLGILVVGSLTTFAPGLFEVSTVWSRFGSGYGFVPLVLPIVAIVYLLVARRSTARRSDRAGRTVSA
jgi:cytochrome bd-type quinol oxidase subunit 2